MAWICVYQAQNTEIAENQERHMKLALEYYKKCDLFAQRATQDEISLQLLQRELEPEVRVKLIGLSVSETLYKLYLVGGDLYDSKANKIKSDFKVPPNRFAWNKVKALAQGKHWEAIKKFSKTDPPIGYKPFAEVCLTNGNKEEAIFYIKKVPDAAERALLFGRADAWGDAIAVVRQMKSAKETLHKLKAACTNHQVLDAIRELLQHSDDAQ